MKIATMRSVCVSFCPSDRFGESRNTVPNMIGAKMALRLNVRCQDGSCGSRRGPLAFTDCFAVDSSRASAAVSSSPLRRLCRAPPCDLAACDHRVHDGAAEVIREVAPVVCRDEG